MQELPDLIISSHKVGQTDRLSDRLSDQLQELLELLFATKN